jgi:hypothetical protein
MQSTMQLLAAALAPYKVALGPEEANGSRMLSVTTEAGTRVVHQELCKAQLSHRSLLVDVVDGVLRDLQIHEGRLAPNVIAALQPAILAPATHPL